MESMALTLAGSVAERGVGCVKGDKTSMTFTILRVAAKSEKTSGVHIVQSRPELALQARNR